MDLKKFRRNISGNAFSCASSFLHHVRYSEFPTKKEAEGEKKYHDCLALRAILVFADHAALQCYQKCPECRGEAALCQERRDESWRFAWTCNSWKGRKCWSEAAGAGGVLSSLRVNSYFPFLHFVLLMTKDYRMKNIYEEMEGAYGVNQKAVDSWKKTYQSALQRYVDEVDGTKVGDIAEVVAVDETAICRDDSKISKPIGFKPKPRTIGSHKRNPLLKKVEPGRTQWKSVKKTSLKKATAKTCMKKRAKKTGQKKRTRYYKPKAGTQDDKRKSRWLWAAVECGSKSTGKKSHKLGNKRISMGLLPRAADAPDGKPRGTKSLTPVLRERVAKGSAIVADKWLATEAAAKKANLKVKGTVNHNKGFRNPVTGVHTNDVESEFARLKLFLRSKFGYVRSSNSTDVARKDEVLLLNVAEYVFYTNVGRDMASIMSAFRHAGGVSGKPIGL